MKKSLLISTTTAMLPQSLVFIDTETTGLSPTRDRIIEIGLVRVENNKVVAKYQTLLNPASYISPFITTLTGISQKDLENAPTFREVKKELHELLTDAVFVAHNVRFDYAFLKNEFKREEMDFTSRHFCTARLSKVLFPTLPRHNLDSIIQRYNIFCEKRHRAYDDAYVLWEFYQRLQKEFSEEVLLKAIQYNLRHPSIPMKLSSSFLETLPELPGVYIFYGENRIPLYIGKSVNIKERVMSHFSGDIHDGREMKLSQQVEDIETITTAGELGALLKEAQLVKELQPFYNRQLRTSRRVVVLRATLDTCGYETIQMEELLGINPDEIEGIKGVFRSKNQAKEYLIQLSKEHSLCEKLLGIEKTKGACFAYRLGNCNGACIQKEKPLVYNIRSLTAFSKKQIKPWPFKGAVAITEKNELSKQQDTFVLNKWCLLGKQSSMNDFPDFLDSSDYRFDVDTYNILFRYLQSHMNDVYPLTESSLLTR